MIAECVLEPSSLPWWYSHSKPYVSLAGTYHLCCGVFACCLPEQKTQILKKAKLADLSTSDSQVGVAVALLTAQVPWHPGSQVGMWMWPSKNKKLLRYLWLNSWLLIIRGLGIPASNHWQRRLHLHLFCHALGFGQHKQNVWDVDVSNRSWYIGRT